MKNKSLSLILVSLLAVSFLAIPVASLAQEDVPPFPIGTVDEGTIDIGELIERLFDWFQYVIITLVIVFIMYAGYLFLTASGDAAKVNTARSHLMYALIGAVIVIAARVFISWAIQFFGLTPAAVE